MATTATIWGEKCVMRILDKNRSVLRLARPRHARRTRTQTFSKLVQAPRSAWCCAPARREAARPRRSTPPSTEVSDPTRNVMTIEDPVEYVFPSINQIQTNEQAGLTFATGLKSILRQDPDVILVGEIRDVETARIAVQSALTGHLVLSSLHATDSVSALHRFLDMGIESFLIASSVIAIVGQRLVRRVCPSCKTRLHADRRRKWRSTRRAAAHRRPTSTWARAATSAARPGYQDRIGVYELLQMTPEIKRLIVGWATQDELRRLAVRSRGCAPYARRPINLVAQDVTTVAEVIRSIYSL